MLAPVLVSFSIIALGWLARRAGVLGPGSERPFNDYLYHFAMPALILDKMTGSGLAGASPCLLAANALAVLGVLAVVFLLWKTGRVGPKLAGELFITSAFGNTVYLGFPLVALRFGADALPLAAIVTSTHYLIVFTLAVSAACIAAGRRDPKAARRMLVTNTILWSSLAGGALAGLGLRLPGVVAAAVALVGSSTAPLALFAVGAFLYGKNLGRDPGAVAVLSVAKLLLFPACCVLCLRWLGVGGLGARVSLLESMMPLAVTNFVIAQKLGFDEELAAEAILASTVAAVPILAGFDRLSAWLLGGV